tara:strand:+ start:241 stop:1071 length:831 start_codon:yes stop_codon:yes gene_type:complete
MSNGPTATPTQDPQAGQYAGRSDSLATYAGPYVTEMLGKGQAIADQPYQAYMGPLSAGASEVQEQAFSGLANLAVPTTPATFDAAAAETYMNPFIEGALNPQLQAAQRQADAQRLANAAKMGQVGAFGGSRLGLVEAEGTRNLNEQLANIRATGYAQAYDRARDQLAADRRYGLDAIGAQRAGGAEQRAIEGEGIAQDYAQFREERDFPYKQLAFQSSLLQGLPIAAQSYSYTQPSALSTILGEGAGILKLLGIGGGDKEGEDSNNPPPVPEGTTG